MASRYPGFGSRNDDNEYKEDLVTIGTHFDPLEPTNSTSILATLGRKASKLVDLSASNYGYDGKRFHGAFTGGFNAGFYNTVGSVEGWRPSEFRSSRDERAEKRSYEPEDFMDKGDFGDHGINPKQIKIRSTFDQNELLTRSSAKKPSGTSNQRTNDDILRDMIKVKTLSIGKRILMSMGWKPGEGVGAKMTRKHRKKLKWSLTQQKTQSVLPKSPPPLSDEQPQPTDNVKVYGVTMPPPQFQQTLTKTSRLDDDDDDDDYFDDQIYANVSLPPLDYEVHFQLQKNDHHGIGYKGLESLNLFEQPSVEKQISNVKIRGQAFGVGIEEDEDDKDLFAEDDLKQYDYELTAANDTTTDIMKKKEQEYNFVLKFVRYESVSMPVVYQPPIIPVDFRVGHRFPKSLMPPPPTPTPSSTVVTNENPTVVPTRQLDANARGLLLGDLSFLSQPPPNMAVPPPSQPPPPPLPPKQETIIPPTPAAPAETTTLEWDMEKERSAQKGPTVPVNNALAQFLDAVKDRFVSSSDREHHTERQILEAALENDLKKAVSLKMYGDLTRSTKDWKPNPLLCKRMNIPDPYPNETYDDSKESKKSRRQLCSNLFEHLFNQPTANLSTASEQTLPPPPSSTQTPPARFIPPVISLPNLDNSVKPPVVTPVAPQDQPSGQFATIDSFEQEVQERPPLDLFSAIFDNQDSDEENIDEQETEENKPVDIPKPINTQSTITLGPSIAKRPIFPIVQTIHDSDESNSSDSSIEEIEPPTPSSSMYGPEIPTNLSSRSKTENKRVWTKTENTDEEFEEYKPKKKHKKKKKHHKKSKKHHHQHD